MNINFIHDEHDVLQRGITHEQMEVICERAFASMTIRSVTELEFGMFNNTFKVETADERFILRISPHPDTPLSRYEQDLMRREYSIQPFLAPLSNLFPKCIYSDFTRTLINRDYVVITFLEGENWHELKDSFSKEENDRIWFEAGETAKLLSSITSDNFGSPSPAPQYSSWYDYVCTYMNSMRNDLAAKGFVYPEVNSFLESAERFKPALDLIDKGRLVHGDMWPKNILIQKHGGNYRISGIIDSERAYWGDEASEWIHAFINVSPSFWDGYGKLYCPDGKEERLQFYYGMHNVMATIESRLRDNNHPEWSLNNLARLNERLCRK